MFREAAAKTSTLPEAAWLLAADAVGEEELWVAPHPVRARVAAASALRAARGLFMRYFLG